MLKQILTNLFIFTSFVTLLTCLTVVNTIIYQFKVRLVYLDYWQLWSLTIWFCGFILIMSLRIPRGMTFQIKNPVFKTIHRIGLIGSSSMWLYQLSTLMKQNRSHLKNLRIILLFSLVVIDIFVYTVLYRAYRHNMKTKLIRRLKTRMREAAYENLHQEYLLTGRYPFDYTLKEFVENCGTYSPMFFAKYIMANITAINETQLPLLPEEFDALRSFKVEEGCSKVYGTECGICLIAFERDLGVAFNCGHNFHFDCMAEWLSNKPQCPMCRAPCRAALLRQVYRQAKRDRNKLSDDGESLQTDKDMCFF